MRTYDVKKSDRIVIYGAAYVGKDICRKMAALGYQVDAFLDKRADVIQEAEGRRVYMPDEFQCNAEEIIVIISTSNPLSVANYLWGLGYRKIIYKSFTTHTSSDVVRQMAKVYNGLVEGQGLIDGIPYYNEEMDERFVDGAWIGHDNDMVRAFVPTDLMFEKEKTEEHIYVKYAELLAYLKAFDGNAMGIIDTIRRYSLHGSVEKLNGEDYELSPTERVSYTQLRLNELNLQLNYGMNWFIENPVEVYAENGKFYVQHKDIFKICFLLSKGLQRIPAVMSEKDYAYWKNMSAFNEVVDYARKRDVIYSYTMLEHPNFFNFPIGRDVGGNARMVHICRFLKENHIDIAGKKVMDIGSYYGFLSRFFARLGGIVTGVEFNKDTYGMGMRLNKLMHCEEIETICGGAQDVKRDNEFDITVMLTVLYWHLDTPLGLELLYAVDNMTKKWLLWESGGEPEREKKFIIEHSSFSRYYKICETTGSGVLREMGAFCK